MIELYHIPRYALIIWGIILIQKLKNYDSFAHKMISLALLSFISIPIASKIMYRKAGQIEDTEKALASMKYISMGEDGTYFIAWLLMTLGLRALIIKIIKEDSYS